MKFINQLLKNLKLFKIKNLKLLENLKQEQFIPDLKIIFGVLT